MLYERDQNNPHIIVVLEFLRINGVMANSSMDRSMQIDFSPETVIIIFGVVFVSLWSPITTNY